jgi:hypothetical protein
MTTWTRIEVMGRTEELTPGLQARVADPLWLLSRQWQVGEFQGDDSARPTAAEAVLRSRTVSAASGPLDPAVAAAAEPTGTAAALHAGTRAGRQLCRRLDLAGLGAAASALRQRFPATAAVDPVVGSAHDIARATLMARFGLDAGAVAAASPADLDAALTGLPQTQRTAASTEITAWASEYRAEAAGSGSGAWDEERLEYSFPVTTDGTTPVTLTAPGYPGGELDWYEFDVASDGGAPGSVRTTPVAAIPTPVRYQGMPTARWFEFEDGQVDFGSLDAGPADLARLLVAEFATSYSGDWFLIPVRLAVGTLTEVVLLRVTDNFGQTTTVPAAAIRDAAAGGSGGSGGSGRPWRLFELAGDEPGPQHPSPWLFLPPVTAGGLTGPALERVVLARDEAANLAWGVERLVEGVAGRAVDRALAWSGPGDSGSVARPVRAPGSGVRTTWQYRLEATAPPWWIPLVPEQLADGSPEYRLRRARMESWRLLPSGPAGPRSELLDPTRPIWFDETEVPDMGVSVERRWRYARWWDGSVRVWLERVKTPGTGTRSSGVRWDLLRAADPVG